MLASLEISLLICFFQFPFVLSQFSCSLNEGYANCNFNESLNNSTESQSEFRKFFSTFHCACDKQCKFFDDCCIDAKYIRLPTQSPTVKPNCFAVTIQRRVKNVQLINECPVDWNNDRIQERCESKKNSTIVYPYDILDEEFYINEVMVFSNRTKVFYSNVFCAICNGDTEDLIQFDLNINCLLEDRNNTSDNPNLIDFETLKANANYEKQDSIRNWHIRYKEKMYKCFFEDKKFKQFVASQSERILRPCVRSIKDCPQNWSEGATRQKCHSYTNYVFAKEKIYKNIDCALCNREDPNELNCLPPQRKHAPSKHHFVNLGILLDLNIEVGNIVGTKYKNCLLSEGKVFNPISKKCINFGCFDGHKFDSKTGQCVLKQDSSQVATKENYALCVLNGVLMHYFYLSSFFWMNVMSFDVYRLFSRKTNNLKSSKKFLKYSVYAWITPLIIIAFSLLNEYLFPENDYQPKYGLQSCWISYRRALLLFFAVPLIVLLITNGVFFALTLKILLETKKATSIILKKPDNIRFKMYLKLALIMGFTWAFAFIASFNGISQLWYPFIVLNGLQGVNRHGDRTPLKLHPNDPYREENYWSDGLGQLTQMGKKRMYKLGLYLRKRYSSFLTKNSREMYIQSSEKQRCKESANLIAAGIYLPHSQEYPKYKFSFPIKTIPLMEDILLTMKPHCPVANVEFEKVKRSSELINFSEKYEHLFKFLSEKYHANISDIFKARNVYMNLVIERSVGYKLPNWINSSTMEQLKTLAGYSFYFPVSTQILQKLRAGVLIDEILSRFQLFDSKSEEKGKDNKKIFIYSTHDTKLAALLTTLGVFNKLTPPFGSTVIFELHSSEKNGNLVKAFYLNETETEKPEILYFPACNYKQFCSLSMLRLNLNNKIPKDWKKECGFSENKNLLDPHSDFWPHLEF
ncbi:lysosomal acid phosphatase-like protein 3 [Dinothrombium tinctorium]|uniref:Lysosomal acid phosphatase-like protein 3 n=1 Tax=Dinothrombium tinctorium TaxID=1965070 RepID=A0A3S3S6I7_9ACAR|nr:lysosomal acid phosphatase-like protein 3 [Dinothrombium tinctorium]